MAQWKWLFLHTNTLSKFRLDVRRHILQVLTELDEEATVVSVDGISAFDFISRNVMMSRLTGIVCCRL